MRPETGAPRPETNGRGTNACAMPRTSPAGPARRGARAVLPRIVPLVLALLAGSLFGCGGEPAAVPDGAAGHAPAPEPTNRIDVPPAVRKNLGISFVKVARRPVRRTDRYPGQFELLPRARQDYHAALEGTVRLEVDPFDRVEPGDLLYTMDSPQWRRLKRELADAFGAVRTGEARVRVAGATLREARERLERTDERLASLASVDVRRADLEYERRELAASLPRLEAEADRERAALDAAREKARILLETAASYAGVPVEALTCSAEHPVHDAAEERWRSLDRIDVRARSAGVVETVDVTNGAWMRPGERVLSVIDPHSLRFRAHAPQGDLRRFHTGQDVRVVPTQGGTVDLEQAVPGRLVVGFFAHPDQRSLPLYTVPEEIPDWALPGVTAYLEVFLDGGADPELAIPLSSVMRDGLVDVFFRRDPKNPDQVIRAEADLGVDDGRWVVVKSGVREGDEVVLEGAYELGLASSGSAPRGGHFHADGEFHDDHGGERP